MDKAKEEQTVRFISLEDLLREEGEDASLRTEASLPEPPPATARRVTSSAPPESKRGTSTYPTAVFRIIADTPATTDSSLLFREKDNPWASIRRHDLRKNSLYVGRDKQADIFLDAPGVSRRHALIQRQTHGWTIRDVGSANGTYINHRLANDAVRLSDHDAIWIGSYVLRFLSAPTVDALNARMPEEVFSFFDQDALTGVQSYRTFSRLVHEQLRNSLWEPARSGGLILCSIDSYPELRTHQGDAYTDILLCKIALILRELLGGLGYVARLEKDVFLLWLADHDREDAKKFASQVWGQLCTQEIPAIHSTSQSVTISGGLAFPKPGDINVSDIVDRAFEVLDRARKRGGGTLVCERSGTCYNPQPPPFQPTHREP